MDSELLQRLDYIEFRQRLLFDNDDFSRLLFDYEVTKDQYSKILDLFDSLREQVDNSQTISSVHYEISIYKIVPQHDRDYHFAEDVAKTLHGARRYEEVFEGLYGDALKFQSYLESKHS